jgi:hypothetical protein
MLWTVTAGAAMTDIGRTLFKKESAQRPKVWRKYVLFSISSLLALTGSEQQRGNELVGIILLLYFTFTYTAH